MPDGTKKDSDTRRPTVVVSKYALLTYSIAPHPFESLDKVRIGAIKYANARFAMSKLADNRDEYFGLIYEIDGKFYFSFPKKKGTGMTPANPRGRIAGEYSSTIISLEQLFKINGSSNRKSCEYYIDALNNILPRYEISTPLRLAHFLAQVIHESKHLAANEENFNYSAKGLIKIFGGYFTDDPNDKTKRLAKEYADKKGVEKEKSIANYVYANRMENGDESGGDGYKFRGRGLIQLTGRANYRECGKALGLDFENNPSLAIANPEIIVESACWFWKNEKLNIGSKKMNYFKGKGIEIDETLIGKTLNEIADKDKVIEATLVVNGGVNNLEERKKIWERAKKELKIK